VPVQQAQPCDGGPAGVGKTAIGSSCDKSELRTSVMAVLGTADKYDDEIMGRWGGKRALDRT
jgi:hypothetical protein